MRRSNALVRTKPTPLEQTMLEPLTLEVMLEGMTEANLHGEIGFGGPVGSEAL